MDTNRDQSKEKLIKVQGQVDTLKTKTHQNIVAVMERGVKIDDLTIKSEQLQQDSGVFQRGAKQLKDKMWWKNIKMKLMIVGIIAIVLTILITVIVLSAKNSSKGRRLDFVLESNNELNAQVNGLINYVMSNVPRVSNALNIPAYKIAYEIPTAYLRGNIIISRVG